MTNKRSQNPHVLREEKERKELESNPWISKREKKGTSRGSKKMKRGKTTTTTTRERSERKERQTERKREKAAENPVIRIFFSWNCIWAPLLVISIPKPAEYIETCVYPDCCCCCSCCSCSCCCFYYFCAWYVARNIERGNKNKGTDWETGGRERWMGQ